MTLIQTGSVLQMLGLVRKLQRGELITHLRLWTKLLFRWGMLNLVNQLFKIYFKLNKLHLTKPLIRAVDSSPLRDKYYL